MESLEQMGPISTVMSVELLKIGSPTCSPILVYWGYETHVSLVNQTTQGQHLGFQEPWMERDTRFLMGKRVVPL